MAALRAINPRKSMVRIATFEKAGNDLFLDQAPQPALGAKFTDMAPGALIKRARARIAWPVRSSAGRIDRGAGQNSSPFLPANRNSLHKDRNAFADRRSILCRWRTQRMCKRKLHTGAPDTHCYKFGWLDSIIGWQSRIGAGLGAFQI